MARHVAHPVLGIQDQEGEQWRKLLTVYAKAKDLYTKAEEIDPEEFRTFVQPVNELRNALDHIMRAKMARLPEYQIEDAERYIRASLDKALGHVYRCFFDIADWMSICLRERFRTELRHDIKPFSNACIMAVWPEYYRDHRSKIDGISRDLEIAKLRADKDVSSDELLQEVDKYSTILDEFVLLLMEAEKRKAAMIEWTLRDRRESRRAAIIRWIELVFTAIAASLVTWWIIHSLTFTPPRNTGNITPKSPVALPRRP